MAKVVILILMLLKASHPFLTLPEDFDPFDFSLENFDNDIRDLPPPQVDFDYPRQSPVDLISCKTVRKDLPVLHIFSDILKDAQTTMVNNGHTVEVYLAEEMCCDKRPYLQGGPFNNKFVLRQLHFHWGIHDYWGSEHFIDGTGYPMEGHLVFFNSKYSSFDIAKGRKDGLAVLAVIIQARTQNNTQMDAFISRLSEIQQAKSVVELNNAEALEWAFGAVRGNLGYYTYPGSLTTEPFSENVIWIVLPKSIYLSLDQINAFRSLRAENGTRILHNKRELQPLFNRRIVFSKKLSLQITENLKDTGWL